MPVRVRLRAPLFLFLIDAARRAGRKQFYDNGFVKNCTTLNASQTLLNKPASFAVDPTNGEIYIADGYGR